MGRRGRKPKIKVEDLEVKTHTHITFCIPRITKNKYEQLMREIQELCTRLDLPSKKYIILLNALELYKNHLQQQLEERLSVGEKKEETEEQEPQVIEEKKEKTITFTDILNAFTKSEQKYISLIEENEDYIKVRVGYIRDKRLWGNIHKTLISVFGAEYRGSGIYEIPKSEEEREENIKEYEQRELERKVERQRKMYELQRRTTPTIITTTTTTTSLPTTTTVENKSEESYFDRLGKQMLQQINCKYAKSIRYDNKTWSYRVYCDYLKKEVDLDFCKTCTIKERESEYE